MLKWIWSMPELPKRRPWVIWSAQAYFKMLRNYSKDPEIASNFTGSLVCPERTWFFLLQFILLLIILQYLLDYISFVS
jgi:hypothetical protein